MPKCDFNKFFYKNTSGGLLLEASSEPSQTCETKRFAKIVNGLSR